MTAHDRSAATGTRPTAWVPLLALGALVFAFAGAGCKDPCDEADCDWCEEACVVNDEGKAQCLPSGRFRCDNGACVSDFSNCHCGGSCDECTERCGVDDECADSGRKRCPDGQCIRDSEACPQAGDCTDANGDYTCSCEEYCADGRCNRNFAIELCPDGTCRPSTNPSQCGHSCPPGSGQNTCEPCTEVCVVYVHDNVCENAPISRKRCQDGRCIPYRDCCGEVLGGNCLPE